MAKLNYTVTDPLPHLASAPAQPFALVDLCQKPGIGNIESLIKGKEDQTVMILRMLIALAEVAGSEADNKPDCLNSLVNLYRRNIDELAMVAKLVLSPAVKGCKNG